MKFLFLVLLVFPAECQRITRYLNITKNWTAFCENFLCRDVEEEEEEGVKYADCLCGQKKNFAQVMFLSKPGLNKLNLKAVKGVTGVTSQVWFVKFVKV